MSANPSSSFDPFRVFPSPLSGDVNQRITAPVVFTLPDSQLCWRPTG